MTVYYNRNRAKLYKILWESGGENFCFYCQCRVYRKQRTLDHLTPKSRGGTWDQDNIVLSCKTCNWAKADMTLAEFADFVAEHGGIHNVKEVYGSGSHSRMKSHSLPVLETAGRD